MYRPEGWINPYLQQDERGDFVNSRVYEAGADAILKAIKEELDLEDVESYGKSCGCCGFLWEELGNE